MQRFPGWPILFGLLVGCSSTESYNCNSSTWQDLVRQHEVRYPGLGMADVYKLLHQATMGSEHAVPSVAEANAWMQSEVAHLGIGPSEPLEDSLGGNSRFVRIHLRPYLATGGSADSLVAAFILTAQTSPPDTVSLKCALGAWQEMAATDSLWRPDSVKAFVDARVQSGYHAIEHSDSFVALYHPAYRVVARTLLPLWRRGIR